MICTGGPRTVPEEHQWRYEKTAQPSTEELWWYPGADTRAEPGAMGLKREDLQQLLCTTGQGVTQPVVLLREEAPRAAVQGTDTWHWVHSSQQVVPVAEASKGHLAPQAVLSPLVTVESCSGGEWWGWHCPVSAVFQLLVSSRTCSVVCRGLGMDRGRAGLPVLLIQPLSPAGGWRRSR